MENATKALIIAAGMLLAIMILSLLTISYNNLTDYLNQDEKIKEVEQITRFNSQFENYNRKDVRGSDILSLVSKIKDYNERYSYQEGTKYPEFTFKIDLGNDLSVYKYTIEDETQKEYLNNTTIFSSNILTKDNVDDILNTTRTAQVNGKTVKEEQLQKLSANVANIIIPSRENYKKYDSSLEKYKAANEKRIKVIKEILGITLTLNGNRYYDINETSLIQQIEIITNKYYQLTQFKRAYFECVKTEYDKNTSRIIYMEFKFTGNFG